MGLLAGTLNEYRQRGSYVVSFSATVEGRIKVNAESEDEAKRVAVNTLENQMEGHGYGLVAVDNIEVTPKEQDDD